MGTTIVDSLKQKTRFHPWKAGPDITARIVRTGRCVLATRTRRATAGRTTSRLAPVRTAPRRLRRIELLGRLAGGTPDRRIGLLDAQIRSFVANRIGGAAKLTGTPRSRILAIVLAQESDLSAAPGAAAIGALAGGATEGATGGRATETGAILFRSHC